jgi:hypothetical protein
LENFRYFLYDAAVSKLIGLKTGPDHKNPVGFFAGTQVSEKQESKNEIVSFPQIQIYSDFYGFHYTFLYC